MKYAKIWQICKKRSVLTVFSHNGTQWISTGAAAYPMYGMPFVRTKDELLAMIDVPADERDSFEVFFENPTDDMYGDITAEDTQLDASPVSFVYGSSTLTPLAAAEDPAVYWINEMFLAPLTDLKAIGYVLRRAKSGTPCVAVVDGMSIQAVIATSVAHERLADAILAVAAKLGTERGSSDPQEVPKQEQIQV